MKMLLRTYYELRPLIPRHLQVLLHQCYSMHKLSACRETWPIDEQTASIRPSWNSWPEGKRFALILTHDVETADGVAKCPALIDMEEELGFRSSFNFVPERYTPPAKIHDRLTSNGFEVGVHGLVHDGKLYKSKRIFTKRAAKINSYLEQWNAVGFRSPSMHHNLTWLHDLNISYDASTFDTDPFEPNHTGTGRIFPFWVAHHTNPDKGYIELPYTLSQDSTLFLFLRKNNIDIWKRKLDWLVQHGGMALLNTHPDYMNFSSAPSSFHEYPAAYYYRFLEYIQTNYQGQYWHVLPHEIAQFAFERR